jgi:hypothetical protein
MNQMCLCHSSIYLAGSRHPECTRRRKRLSSATAVFGWIVIVFLLTAYSPAWADISHTKIFVQQGGSSSASTFTFTASANASNEAVVIGVNCVSTTAATGVSITATGWSFTRLGNIGFSGASSAAVFGAISPNTTSATFTVTWTGAGNCTFHREMGDEFAGADTTGGTTTFDCGGSTCSGGSNNAHSTNGSCGVNVTTGSANEALWGVCWPNNSVTALGSGYSAGANDGQGDRAEYKLTGDGAGTVETINFTSTTTFNAIAVAIRPAVPTTQITHSKVFAQQAGSSSASTFTFTASANAVNEAVIIGVNCVSTTAATGVSLTATGWNFTQLGNIGFSGASSSAAFGAISPNTTSATFTVSWTGAGNCTFHREMGDEFAGADTTGGTTTFDCVGACSGGSNNANSTNGNCSVSVTTGVANEAVWGVCWPSNSVTALGSGYSPGANDSQGDRAEYKLTGDAAGTQETVNFTSSTTYNALAVTIKPAPAPSITSLTPNRGLVGTSIVISGTGFGPNQGTGTVQFNGTAATVGSWSSTAIQVTVPSLPLGAASVRVTVPGAGTSNAVTFTVVSFDIAATMSPAPNSAGWNNSNVTVASSVPAALRQCNAPLHNWS